MKRTHIWRVYKRHAFLLILAWFDSIYSSDSGCVAADAGEQIELERVSVLKLNGNITN